MRRNWRPPITLELATSLTRCVSRFASTVGIGIRKLGVLCSVSGPNIITSYGFIVAGRDQSAADQPNNLAEGHPPIVAIVTIRRKRLIITLSPHLDRAPPSISQQRLLLYF
jgi:hypothetical protein